MSLPMTTTTKLEAALTYASWGWHVLPLIPNDKRPASAHGVHDATIDPEQIKAWWAQNPSFNIGIAAGEKSGIVVFDIDPRNGGAESWDDFTAEHGGVPDGICQLTAGGGQHYIAQARENLKSCELRRGVDFLANGRYFVVTPSVVNDREYTWEASGDPTDGICPFEIPEAWLSAMAVRKVIVTATDGALITGNRNAGLASMAGSMRHSGFSASEIFAAISAANAERCDIPLPASDVKRIAESIGRYAPEHDVGANAALGDAAAENLIGAQTVRISQAEGFNATTLRATEYVIDGFIGMGLTILAGEPGGGKTSIIVPVICHAAHLCRYDSFLKPEIKRHVVYVSEDTEQVERCLYAMNKYGSLDIEQDEFNKWFHLYEARRADPQAIAKMLVDLDTKFSYESQSGFVIKPVIVFDTSNATIDIENENDNSEVGKVIALLKESANGMAIIVVAHTAKALSRADVDNMTPRGASAWIGDARATVYLFRDEKLPEARFLALGKRRFEPVYTEIRFDSVTHSETVATPWGTTQSVGLRVVTAQPSSQAERKEASKAGEQAAAQLLRQERYAVVISALTALARDEYLTKSELTERIGGSKNIAIEIVDSMVKRREIEEIYMPFPEHITKRAGRHNSGYVMPKSYKKESNGD